MNHTVINPITHEEIDDRTQFIIAEGRYYAFMFFISLPRELSNFGQGGDINGMLWRLNEEPNEWTFQFRFRQYRDERAFGSKDKKRWYAAEITATSEGEARAKAEEAMQLMLVAGIPFGVELKIDRLEVGGDCNKFYQIVQEQQPYWMHTQQMVQE